MFETATKSIVLILLMFFFKYNRELQFLYCYITNKIYIYYNYIIYYKDFVKYSIYISKINDFTQSIDTDKKNIIELIKYGQIYLQFGVLRVSYKIHNINFHYYTNDIKINKLFNYIKLSEKLFNYKFVDRFDMELNIKGVIGDYHMELTNINNINSAKKFQLQNEYED